MATNYYDYSLKSTDDCRKLLSDRGVHSSNGQFYEVIVPRMYYTPHYTQQYLRSPPYNRFIQGGYKGPESDRFPASQEFRPPGRGFDSSNTWRNKNDAKTEEEHRIRKNSSAGIYSAQDARSLAGQDNESLAGQDNESLAAPVISIPNPASGPGAGEAHPTAKPLGSDKADQKPKIVAESSKTDSRQVKTPDMIKEDLNTEKKEQQALGLDHLGKATPKGAKSGKSKGKDETKLDLRKQNIIAEDFGAGAVNTEPPKNIGKKRKATRNRPPRTSPVQETTEHQGTAENLLSRPGNDKIESVKQETDVGSQSDNQKEHLESIARNASKASDHGQSLRDSTEEKESEYLEKTSSLLVENERSYGTNLVPQKEALSSAIPVPPSQHDTQGHKAGTQEIKEIEPVLKDVRSLAETSDTKSLQDHDVLKAENPILEDSRHHTAKEAPKKSIQSLSPLCSGKSSPTSKQKHPANKIVPAVPDLHTLNANKKYPNSKVEAKASSPATSPNVTCEDLFTESAQEEGLDKDNQSVFANRIDTPDIRSLSDTPPETVASRNHPATQTAPEQTNLGDLSSVAGLDGSSSNHGDQHTDSIPSIAKARTSGFVQSDEHPSSKTPCEYGSESVSTATQEEVNPRYEPETPEKGMTAPLSATSSAFASSTDPNTPSSARSSKDPIDQSNELSSIDQKMLDQVKTRLEVGKSEHRRIENFVSRSDTTETRKNQWKTQVENLEQQLHPLCDKILENENSRIRQQGNSTRRKKVRNKLRDDWKFFDSFVEDLRMFQGRLEREEKQGQKTAYSNSNGGENDSHVMDEEAQQQYSLLTRKLAAKMSNKRGNTDAGLNVIFFKTDQNAPSESSTQHSDLSSRSPDLKRRFGPEEWRDVHSDEEDTIHIEDKVVFGELGTTHHITESEHLSDEMDVEQGQCMQNQKIESTQHRDPGQIMMTESSEPTLTAAIDGNWSSPSGVWRSSEPGYPSPDGRQTFAQHPLHENAYTSSENLEPTTGPRGYETTSLPKCEYTSLVVDEDRTPNSKPVFNLESSTEGIVGLSENQEATIGVNASGYQIQSQELGQRRLTQVSQLQSVSSKEENDLVQAEVGAQIPQAEAVTSTPIRPTLKNWAQVARGDDQQTTAAGENNSQNIIDIIGSAAKTHPRTGSFSSDLANAGPPPSASTTPESKFSSLTTPRGRSVPGSSPRRRVSPNKLELPSQASGGSGGRRESFPRLSTTVGDGTRKPSDDWKVGPSGTWPGESVSEAGQETNHRADNYPKGGTENNPPMGALGEEQQDPTQEKPLFKTDEEKVLATVSTGNEQNTNGKKDGQAKAGKKHEQETTQQNGHERDKAEGHKRGNKGRNKTRTGKKGSGSSRASLT